MTTVYAWPPVGAVGSEWTVEDPVNSSRGLLNGKRYLSAVQRRRRKSTVVVSALSAGKVGAGYCEVLKRLLDGGVNLVRLKSLPINWHVDVSGDQSWRRQVELEWQEGDLALSWSERGDRLPWYIGAHLPYTLAPGLSFPAIRVTGLPPAVLVARPGEFASFATTDAGETVETHMILDSARSDDTGAAVVKLMTGPASAGFVSLGTSETAVFEAVEIPRAVQPVGGNWSYSWTFSEVFEDEVTGGFVEVDPWT